MTSTSATKQELNPVIEPCRPDKERAFNLQNQKPKSRLTNSHRPCFPCKVRKPHSTAPSGPVAAETRFTQPSPARARKSTMVRPSMLRRMSESPVHGLQVASGVSRFRIGVGQVGFQNAVQLALIGHVPGQVLLNEQGGDGGGPLATKPEFST